MPRSSTISLGASGRSWRSALSTWGSHIDDNGASRSGAMTDTTLIANGTIVTAEGEFAGDVLIEGETIAALGRVEAPDGASVIDAGGCFVLPGLIDNHTHLSMPFMGMMSSDDYDTGT